MLEKFIPYGRQSIDRSDIDAVVDVLKSDWLTTGPNVDEFEKAICKYTGAKYAVAVNSGTAGLHAAMFASGISSGDEVIVTAMTFAASSNCIVYQGGTPVFADVLPYTLLIDPDHVERLITNNTKAIIAVDYAGQPCEYDRLNDIAFRHDLLLVADACHSIGGKYKGRNVGTLANMSVFSFHPVKHITTGEGGMITTDNEDLYNRLKLFRNHGITTDHRQRSESGHWFYEMTELGYNYRITDFQCALGISQLAKLDTWIDRRQEIAERYESAIKYLDGISPLMVDDRKSHAYHLYVVKMKFGQNREKSTFFKHMKDSGIGVNVHYIPVHLHPYYRDKYGTKPGMCPVAETSYEEIVSLPIFPELTDNEQDFVVDTIKRFLK